MTYRCQCTAGPGDIHGLGCPVEGVDECGETYEHELTYGDTECRRCGADLSSWTDDEDDYDGN